MRSPVLVLLASAVAAVRLASAAPYVGYAYPAGQQVATSVRILIGGQGLRGVRGAWVSGSGVTVTKVSQVPNFPYFNTYGYREWTKKWIDAVAEARHLGSRDVSRTKPALPKAEDMRFWPKCGWWERIDALDELEFAVAARDMYTKKDTLQDIAALSQLLIADITVSADAEPGKRDLIVYDGKGASAPHPFLVTAEPHVQEALFVPPAARDPDVRVHVPPVVLDGRILPREKDAFTLKLTEGRRLVCELVGRELEPYVGDAVPGFFNPVVRLTDEEGNELSVADDYGYLPDPVLVFDVKKSGSYVLEIRDNLFRGRPDFVYSITCRETDVRETPPSVCDRAFVCGHPAVRVESPVDVLVCPGASAVHELRVDAPGRWSFDLFARRLGSPLDGVLRLCTAEGKDLSVWDDVTNAVHVGNVPQVEYDPRGEWTFSEAGCYFLRVEDRLRQGGRDYRYSLAAGPSRPAFDVYSEQSAFRLETGERGKVSFKVRVVRKNGFAGAVVLDDTDDFAFDPGLVPEAVDSAQVTAVSRRDDWQGVREVSFTASAVSADGPKGVRVIPAAAVEQAFAYSHLLPAKDFRFLRPPQQRQKLECPTWIYMPVDQFSPNQLVYTTAELAEKPSSAAIDALAKVEAPVVPVPADADDALLAARFAAACAHVVPPRRGRPVAYDPPGAPLSADACARALLAGATRIVETSLRYADGDEKRVRTLARAASLSCDNDTLLFVHEGSVSPSGAFGSAARALRDGGYCFDYVTASLLTNAQVSARYRTLFVPKLTRKLPSPVVDTLLKKAERGWTVLFEDSLPGEGARRRELLAIMKKGVIRHGKGRLVVGDMRKLIEVKTAARRERFGGLDKLRFARFSDPNGRWYFIHNPTRLAVTLSGRPVLGGPVGAAAALDVSSGVVERLAVSKDGAISLSLSPLDSVWLFACRRRFDE